jgi:RND family efflux transporter MFP subunit
MTRKIIITIVIIAVLAGGGYAAYTYYFSAPTNARAAVTNIQTAVVRRGNLTTTISATGSVRPKQDVLLNWGTSGTVEKVSVNQGDTVKAGQTLASLKPSSLPQSLIQAEGDLVSAQKALADLNKSAATARTQAVNEIQTYTSAVRDAQYAFDNFSVPSGQTGLNTADGLVKTARALDTARKAFEPYKYASELDTTRQDLLTSLGNAQADYDAAVKRLALESKLNVAKDNLQNAIDNLNKYKDGPDPADVTAAKAKIAAIQAGLAQAQLQSPIDGTVTDVNAQVGDQVAGGRSAFQIDDLSRMYVDLKISEVDIPKIQAGQPVSVTLDALPGKVYPGKIDQVSSINDTSSTSTINYIVTVLMDKPDGSVRTGMTAEAQIIVGDKPNVVLIPLQAIQTTRGQQVVYVVHQGQSAAPVTVTMGASSGSFGELTSGNINPGDRIVLDPTAFQTAQQAAQQRGGLLGLPFNGPNANAGRVIFGGGGGDRGPGGQQGGNNTGGNRTGGTGNTGGSSGGNTGGR